MKRLFILVFLAILWLLMSGVYKTLILLFGILSVLLVIFFVKRMNEKDGYELDSHIAYGKMIRYIGWLLVEVIKSNVSVSRILLSRQCKIDQNFIEIPISQKSDLAKVIFANSITLTPGTVTVETEDKKFLVHALNVDNTTEKELENMNVKVTDIER